MASGEGNWGKPIVALTAFFLALVIIFLTLRIITRVWIVKSFWWDDFTIILAVLGTTIGAGLDFVEVGYGFGKHQQFLTPYHLQEFRKYTYGEWIQTFATLMWTKVSICLFLMRIPDSKALLRSLQWAVAFLLFSNTILTVVWIMQCQPLHAAWDDRGICMSRGALEGVILAQAVISVVSDFSFAAFPILILWRVQIDFKTKLGLWFLMCLGFITGACCLVRTVLNNQSVPLDGTYDGIVNWVWRLFEVQIGIIAACIPTLRPLFMWTSKRFKGNRSEYDPNIKFIGNESGPWTSNGNAKHSRNRGSSDLRETKPRETSPMERSTRERRDTMRDELIREGIVAAGRENTSLRPETARPQPNVHGSFSGLGQEMQKYGLDDSLV